MKRAVLKRFTAFIASLLVVTILSPNFVYSVKASAHEGEAGVSVEVSETEETETEKAKTPKTETEKKTVKETKQVKETEAVPEETKAKETEEKETEAKAAETKATEKKTSESEQAKESDKEAPAETAASETEQVKETSAEPKETAPAETAEETKATEPAQTSESSEPAETSEESQPSESIPAESSETTESSEETESSETNETTAAETAPAAKIKVAESAEEFIKLVASLPESYRLIIDTDKDLSSLNGAKGVFYDGSYVLVFDGIDNYDAALKYFSSKKISFSIDGSVELCGIMNLCNNVTINPKAKTKIAIIDTGSSLANEKVSVMGDKGEDKNGHGTAMASKVLEQTDDAYIISIKAIGDDGNGKVADVYAALQYAIDADCKVVLMAISLRDLGQYEAFKNLVADAVAKGITVVASAGNNGTDASKYIPAGLKDVLTAGAMDKNGVKLSNSNYGKSVEYYVVADSTSEAAAVLAGKVIAGTTDELATTCKMSASSGTDSKDLKFKVNNSEDPATNDFSTSDGETLYNNAAAFCIFTQEFIHSNHMEGSVAADTYTRNTDSIMEITPRIFPYTYAGNYYFYFNNINQNPVDKKMISQSPQDGKNPAAMFLGTDLVYLQPEKNGDGVYQITYEGNTVTVPNDIANNGEGRVVYSRSQKKIVAAGNNPDTLSGGGVVKGAKKNIDFNTVLGNIGKWADKFYDKHDLKISDGTLEGITYTIRLHDGVNFINLTEKQLNDYGFNFIPSSGNCSVVINVVDDGDHEVTLSHSEADKRISFNGIGKPEATTETLNAASHIMFNFHSSITKVVLGESTTTELGTLLATGADLTIKSTHDGNAIAKSFKNVGVEIHQAAFPFIGKNASSSGKVSIKKIFEHPGDEDLSATFVIYEGNYRSVAEINNAGASGDQMTKNSNTYTSKALKEAGPYTIRETKTGANYNGLGDTLIHIMLHSDGSVEFVSPTGNSNITKNSSSTDSSLVLDVTNSRKTASTPGSVKLVKRFTGFTPMEARSATFKLYSGKYTDLKDLDNSALIGEKTFTQNGDVTFTGLDEVGPYTIVETASNNCEEVGFIYLTLDENGKVTFGETPEAVTVKTNNSTTAEIEINNKKKYTEVSISKQDITKKGTELDNASMKLTANAGTMVNLLSTRVSGPAVTMSGPQAITWKSSSSAGPLVLNLPNGSYTLEETVTLKIGETEYEKFTTATFTVSGGKVTETTVNDDDTVIVTGTKIEAFDKPVAKTYTVNISKVDAANSKELAGAKLSITNADGNTFDFSKVTAKQNGADAKDLKVTSSSVTFTSVDDYKTVVSGLEAGKYVLTEVTEPKGYEKAESITFTVGTDGKVSYGSVTGSDTVVMEDKAAPTKVTFSKKEMTGTGSGELTGAKMKLSTTDSNVDFSKLTKTGGSNVTVSGDKKSVTWNTAKEQFKVDLPDGTYTLEETIAPNGYNVITTTTFTVNKGTVTKTTSNTDVEISGTVITAFDEAKKTYEVSISKQEMNGQGDELDGASMKLTASADTSVNWAKARKSGPAVKENGNSITWTSSNTEGPLVVNLPDGTYTLEETATLKIGETEYTAFTTSTFTMKDGKVTESASTASDNTVTFTGTDGRTVTAFNTPVTKTYTVNISKVDAANSKELAGAQLSITNASGNTFDFSKVTAKQNGADAKDLKVTSSSVTFTSVDDYETVVSGLEAGTYVLTETTAPGGYEKAESITFTVGTDGKVSYGSITGSDTVVMEDKAKTTPAPTKVTFSKKEMTGTGTGELTGATMKLSTTETNVDFSKLTKTGGSNVTVSGDKKSVTWKTATEQFKVDLPDGTYTLEETIAPNGYNVITTTNFTVKDGKVTKTTSNTDVEISGTVITAFDEAKKTYEVSISKQEMNGQGDELNGASMKLTASSDTSVNWAKARKSGPAVKENGNSITWTSSNTEGPLVVNLPDGTYTLEETATLKIGETEYTAFTTSTFTMKDGKVTESASTASDKTVTFTGTDGRTVTAFNTPKTSPVPTPTTVTFSKKEMTGTGSGELTGATMELSTTGDVDFSKLTKNGGSNVTVSDDKKSVTWKTSTEQFKVNLPDGTYTLKETVVPDGYNVITTTTFTVKDGKVTKTTSNTDVEISGTVITAFDEAKKTTVVSLSKKDMADKEDDNAKELSGATMKLTPVDGTTVNWNKAHVSGPEITVSGKAITWTTGGETLKINLPDGKYTLEENGAPAGYNVITTTTFEIKDGKVVTSTSETVTADGNTNTVTAFDELKTSDIVFSKKDMADKGKDNAEELPGATMKLTAKSGPATTWGGTKWDAAKKAGPTITMVNGEKAVTWTSSSTQLKIALPDGTYELSEARTPDEYKPITTISFEIKDGKVTGTSSETVTLDGDKNVVTAFDEAKAAPAEISISKKDMADKGKTDAKELEGAKMTLTAVSGDATKWSSTDWTAAKKDGPDVTKVDGANAVTWTTGSKSLKINLPDGKYTLEENGAPAGYKVITTSTFEIKDGKVVTSTSETVTADGNTNTVTAFDELRISEIVFSKKDFDKKDDDTAGELEGATMKLTAKSGPAAKWGSSDWDDAKKEGPSVTMVSGEKAVTWTSGTIQLKLALPDGTYELSEKRAPDNYDVITTITFEIKEGKVTGTSSETVTLDGDKNVVTAFDKAVTPPAPDTSKVTFSKQDMTQKGKELKDATMKLSTTDTNVDFSKLTRTGGSKVKVSDDNKSVTWTTTEAQFAVWLPDGTYTLEETVAPNGYKVITTTTFTVKSGKVDSSESTTDVNIDGVNNIITAFDEAKYFDIELSKEDIAHNLIANATLSVTSLDGHDLSKVVLTQGSDTVTPAFSNGNSTISFKSSGTSYTQIKGLRVGKYVLRETTTPDKYKQAADIYFEITNEGKLTSTNEAFVVGSRVVMIDRADPDYYTKVTINGQDKEDKKDLPDVVITISSNTPTVDLSGVKPTGGDVISQGEKTITIRTKGGPIELGLPDGEFTIKEISGPKGYDKVPTAPFKVEGGKVTPTGTPVNIEIDNKTITVLLPKSDTKKKSSKGSVPATGVGISYTNVAGAALITAAVTAMGICIVVFKKKKEEF